MLALTLALSAASPTAIEAERAFAQMAQDKGQWTAFRATAAPDAVMFVPQPVKAHDFLKDRKDPAKAVRWWPIRSWQSCDGTLAVNTGGAVWPGGTFTRFTTIWQRQPDGGLKWVYDNGVDVASKPEEPVEPQVRQPRCAGDTVIPTLETSEPWDKIGIFRAQDNSLQAAYATMPDGGHKMRVMLAGESEAVHVLDVPAPAPAPAPKK